MKIAHTTDTHLGPYATKKKTLRKMLLRLKKEDFDVLLHTGDFNGEEFGPSHPAVTETLSMIREIFPDKPVVATIGNHDHWVLKFHLDDLDDIRKAGGRPDKPSLSEYRENQRKIVDSMNKYNIHFLDEKGPWTNGDYKIYGCSGWYHHLTPPTNDVHALPVDIEGGTPHHYLNRVMHRKINQIIDEIYIEDTSRVIFASHFPVIFNDQRFFDTQYNWDRRIGETLENIGVKYFFNGHAHQKHSGPLRYEPGSEYGRPNYHIVDVSENGDR